MGEMQIDETRDPHVTRTETCSFDPKKAPGPDGFTADTCIAAINKAPYVFLALLNKCLKSHALRTAARKRQMWS